MDRAPRRVVADCYRRVEDQTLCTCPRAVVYDLAVENRAVGDNNFDIFDGVQACDEEALLQDVTDRVRDLYAVARAEWAHVGQHEPCQHVAHR